MASAGLTTGGAELSRGLVGPAPDKGTALTFKQPIHHRVPYVLKYSADPGLPGMPLHIQTLAYETPAKYASSEGPVFIATPASTHNQWNVSEPLFTRSLSLS